MQQRTFRKTSWLLLFAVLFLFAGAACGGGRAARYVARYASSDGILEEGTSELLGEASIVLLASGGILALLALANARSRRRPFPPEDSRLVRLLSAALVLLLAAYLCFHSAYEGMEMLKLDPAMYAVSALNLLEGKGYVVSLDQKVFPAKYFIGYPLFLAAFYALLGPFPGNAIHGTFASALLALGATFTLSRRMFGVKAATLSALLLCGNRLFVDLAGEVRSELLSAFLMVMPLLLLFLGLSWRRGKDGAFFLMGLAIGAAYAVRPPLVAPLLVAPFAVWRCEGFRVMLRRMAFVAAGLALVAVPCGAYYRAAYGGVFASGYQVWPQPGYENARPLSPVNISFNWFPGWIPPEPENMLQKVERYLLTTNGAFYGSALLGLTWLYNPAVFVFVLAGAALAHEPATARSAVRRVLALCIIAVIAAFAAFYMIYVFQNSRYLVPILPLLLVLAGAGMSARVRFGYQERLGMAGLAWCVLFALAFSGAARVLHRRAVVPPPPPLQYELCRGYNERAPRDGIIITGMDPVLVDYLVLRATDRRMYSLSERGPYVDVKLGLGGGSPPPEHPLRPVARHLGEVRALVRAGRTVLVDDWEDPQHRGIYRNEMELLRGSFALAPAAGAGEFRIYRLLPPKTF